MSTYTGISDTRIINDEKELAEYFLRFAKPVKKRLIGLEAEFFVVYKDTGKAVCYDDPQGVETLLRMMMKEFQYEAIEENHHVVGLKKGDTLVALEPGGQIELSAPPVTDIFSMEKQIRNFIKELKLVCENYLPDVTLIACGMHPFSLLDEISWVPKVRYNLMSRYLAKRGDLSHWMMKLTATNHINLDYSDEKDAMESLRLIMSVTSLVTALFSNSSFSGGKANGFSSKRLDIWNHTDPERTGILLRFLDEGRTFKDYAEYLLDIPIMFLIRAGRWIEVDHWTLREHIRKGYKGMKATWGDFELHLNTVFPEARIKQLIEIRGVDGQSPDLIPSVAALWKGLLYDPTVRKKAQLMMDRISRMNWKKACRQIPVQGMKVSFGNYQAWELAEELVRLSGEGLKKQCISQSEDVFLNRVIEKIIRPKQTSGEVLLLKWENEFNFEPKRLVESLSILKNK